MSLLKHITNSVLRIIFGTLREEAATGVWTFQYKEIQFLLLAHISTE
jgi:hypothetical protein